MDNRLWTFLELCETMNYRRTAEKLHLTQPAVTKHIKALEREYGVRLFSYDGRVLSKTDECIVMEEYCKSLRYNYEDLQRALSHSKDNSDTYIRVGATKTIGDYVLEPQVESLLKRGFNLSLIVDNTEKLLSLLDDSRLDFAVIEGFFNKKKYDYKLLRNEPFIGVCKKGHRFAGKTVSPSEIIKETVILREQGSGTRDILERELMSAGYRADAFAKAVYISSFKLITELVRGGTGISFMYESVVKNDKGFGTFKVEGFNPSHEFNIVYLKNTDAENYVKMFFAADSGK